MSDTHALAIEALLRKRGSQTASELAARLAVSQPTVSRTLARLGERIVRIGRARATRYALGRGIGRAGSRWPLYRINADAQPQLLGRLHALHGDGYYLDVERPLPAFLHGDFADGLFPGLPWFLDDQRPQGFLGRTFVRRVAVDIGAPLDLMRWQSDDVVLALLLHGNDAPGDLVLGETALQRALQDALNAPDAISSADRIIRYPQLAEAALHGEDVGSSAGGEQPKFAITLQDGAAFRPVIVKFSERTDTPAGRRWADLLICEHLASTILADAGLAAAESALVESGGRIFLESTRFDRTPVLGRHGFVSLAALDAAYYGHGRIEWWRFAGPLQRDGWISADDARALRRIAWFGELIANADMHLGNAGLVVTEQRPLALAPAYDMLPMRFRPNASGEVVARAYELALPTPEHGDDWAFAADIARAYWSAVAEDERISQDFRQIAASAEAALAKAVARMR